MGEDHARRSDRVFHNRVIAHEADRGVVFCVQLRKIHDVAQSGSTRHLNEAELLCLAAIDAIEDASDALEIVKVCCHKFNTGCVLRARIKRQAGHSAGGYTDVTKLLDELTTRCCRSHR